MLKEFREFAMKGNMIDLAVGVIIGGAFGTIVNSLVNDVIMPAFGVLLGKTDFKDKFIVMATAEGQPGPFGSLAAAKEAGATTLNYGVFVNAVVSFLIVSFSIFIVIKAMNRMRREPDPTPEAPMEPSDEVKLLTEIRDALKAKG
jgi:large conductance mechanosensitive channel